MEPPQGVVEPDLANAGMGALLGGTARASTNCVAGDNGKRIPAQRLYSPGPRCMVEGVSTTCSERLTPHPPPERIGPWPSPAPSPRSSTTASISNESAKPRLAWRNLVSKSTIILPFRQPLSDLPGVACECVELLPGVRVPDPGRFVPTGGDNSGTVRIEPGRID